MNGQNEFYNKLQKKNLTQSYAIYPRVNTDSTFSVASPPTPSQPHQRIPGTHLHLSKAGFYWLCNKESAQHKNGKKNGGEGVGLLSRKPLQEEIVQELGLN